MLHASDICGIVGVALAHSGGLALLIESELQRLPPGWSAVICQIHLRAWVLRSGHCTSACGKIGRTNWRRLAPLTSTGRRRFLVAPGGGHHRLRALLARLTGGVVRCLGNAVRQPRIAECRLAGDAGAGNAA